MNSPLTSTSLAFGASRRKVTRRSAPISGEAFRAGAAALPGGLAAERTARELQLSNHPEPTPRGGSAEAPPYDRPIPGDPDSQRFRVPNR